MEKILFIIVFLTSYFSLHSQTIRIDKSVIDTSTINIYKFGQPIDSCECNFENLFRNWTDKFITNAKDTKLISYEFVETLKENNIDYYVNWFVQANALGSVTYGKDNYNYNFSDDTVRNKEIKLTRYFHPKFTSINIENLLSTGDFECQYIEINKQIVSARKAFRETISINDKVYLIRFEYGGQTLKNYVICSYETKQIIRDNIFLITSFKSNIQLY